MTSKYKVVVSWWVNPDFSAAERGDTLPPCINYHQVDFPALGLFLEEFSYSGSAVKVRMAPDAIDYLTAAKRKERGDPPSSLACEDFAEALLAHGYGPHWVEAVRESWQPLHYERDRTDAPPPVGLMFILEGTFNTVSMWLAHFQMRLGIVSVVRVWEGGKERTVTDYEGSLPPELSAKLTEVFGIPFETSCRVRRTDVQSGAPSEVLAN